MPKVSVIMAVFNCEKTIRDSINSILNQTFTDWEFVICDDCSSDSTYSVLKEYEKLYPNKFIIIRNDKNSKLAFSLNHCLKYASGEYIARMDGDDESLPERLQKQVEYLDSNPEIAVIGTSMIRFDQNGDYSRVLSERNPGINSLKTDVPHFHATIMMRKSVYDAVNGYTVLPRTVRGQDVDLWFKVYSKGYKGSNLFDYLYRVREDKAAFHRRKLKYDINNMQTRLEGYRMINRPLWSIYAFIPIISYFVPTKIKIWRRDLIASKNSKG